MSVSKMIACNFPGDILRILSHLKSKGIAAYPVGGCVRDAIIGREPTDYDIAAEATPQQLVSALDGYNISGEGIAFGTVCVHTEIRDTEITCCRKESGYSDLRRPDSVDFTKSINDDLARRDFTVNAMAYDVEHGRLIDLFGAVADAENGVLRCVGDPKMRFGEDALRILRLLRFASVLGFNIEEKTKAAAHGMCRSLATLSGERVLSELKGLLCGDNVFTVLTEYSDVICSVIPELRPAVGFDQHNPHHIYTVYDHIAHTVSYLEKDAVLRLTMLFHDMAKPYVATVDDNGVYHFRGHPEAGAEMAEKVLKRLHADTATADEVRFLIKYHDVRPAAERAAIHSYLCKTGFDGARRLLHIRRADLAAQSPAYHDGFAYIDRCEQLIDELWREGAAVKVSDLEINGGDIIALGIEEGPAVGELLSLMLEKVAAETVPNERGALLKECRAVISGETCAL